NGLPDIGTHFLPYDTGNFLYSKGVGYSEQDQESAIKQLNLIVLNATGPTLAEQALINGWYAPDLTAPSLNKNYVPPAWDVLDGGSTSSDGTIVAGDPNGTNHRTYRNIVARMCRTCHAGMPD